MRNKKSFGWVCCLIGTFIFLLAGTVKAATVTKIFRFGVDGYTGLEDTFIHDMDSEDNTNFSTSEILNCRLIGPRIRSLLIKWGNLGTKGAKVKSAEMVLFTLGGFYRYGDKPNADFELFKVLKSWKFSEVTWNRASKDAAWTEPGCWGADEISDAPLVRMTVKEITGEPPVVGSQKIPVIFKLPVDLVQSWIDNPENNHGILINFAQDLGQKADCGLVFNSSRCADEALRPMLKLTLE